MTKPLADLIREADVFTGRIQEAYAEADRAYARMLAVVDEARARAHVLEEERRPIIEAIQALKEATE
jgi:hypothetical protein